MRTYKQGLLWVRVLTFLIFQQPLFVEQSYTRNNIKKATAALENFTATNRLLDTNWALSIIYLERIPRTSLMLFYNGPMPPEGLFSDFLAITSSSSSLSTTTFLNFIINTCGVSESKESSSLNFHSFCSYLGVFTLPGTGGQ
jgi:hypothetical protein